MLQDPSDPWASYQPGSGLVPSTGSVFGPQTSDAYMHIPPGSRPAPVAAPVPHTSGFAAVNPFQSSSVANVDATQRTPRYNDADRMAQQQAQGQAFRNASLGYSLGDQGYQDQHGEGAHLYALDRMRGQYGAMYDPTRNYRVGANGQLEWMNPAQYTGRVAEGGAGWSTAPDYIQKSYQNAQNNPYATGSQRAMATHLRMLMSRQGYVNDGGIVHKPGVLSDAYDAATGRNIGTWGNNNGFRGAGSGPPVNGPHSQGTQQGANVQGSSFAAPTNTVNGLSTIGDVGALGIRPGRPSPRPGPSPSPGGPYGPHADPMPRQPPGPGEASPGSYISDLMAWYERNHKKGGGKEGR